MAGTATRKRNGRSKPVVVVNLGGSRKRRRRSRGYAGAAIWLAVAALFEVIGVLLQITSLILIGLVSLTISIISAIIAHRRNRAGHTSPPTTQNGGNPGKTAVSGPSAPRRTRKPVAGQRARACTRSCQVSSKPRETCDCRCAGANHGRYAGRAAPPNPRKTTTGSGGGLDINLGPRTGTKTQSRPISRTGERRCTKCGRSVPVTDRGGLMAHDCKAEAFRKMRRKTL